MVKNCAASYHLSLRIEFIAAEYYNPRDFPDIPYRVQKEILVSLVVMKLQETRACPKSLQGDRRNIYAASSQDNALSSPTSLFNYVYWVSLEGEWGGLSGLLTVRYFVILWLKLDSRHFLTGKWFTMGPINSRKLPIHQSRLFDLPEPRIPEALTTGKQRLLCCCKKKKKTTTASKCSAAMNCILSEFNTFGGGTRLGVCLWERVCVCKRKGQRSRTKPHFIDKINNLSFLSELI